MTLYAVETYTCRLMAYDIIAPGKVRGASGPGGPGTLLYRPAGYKFFDSLGIDQDGNICIATVGTSGISVVSPVGELVEFTPTAATFTTNSARGGVSETAAITTFSSTRKLVKAKWARPGLKLAF